MPSSPTITLPGGHTLGAGRTFVIAEVGSNHACSLDMALQSIDAAAGTGADAVKFQSIDLDGLYHQPSDATRALHRKIDFPEAWHAPLKQRSDERGLVFLSSPTYLRAIDILESVNVAIYKLASAQIAVFPQLVRRVAQLRKPVVLSTGLATEEHLARVVEIFREVGNDQFIILHCNSVYPAPAEIVHLPRMSDYARRFDCLVGFSDHTQTHTASIGAVALGAAVIERHFTLSRELDSPDAPLSLEPAEFSDFVRAVREADIICTPSPRVELEGDESAFKDRIRHCLVAARDLKLGEILDDSCVKLMRGNPGSGIDAWEWMQKAGTLRLLHDVPAGGWIAAKDVSGKE